MTRKDFYTVLGVEKGASDDEIKKKYYILAKKYHPDKNQEDGAEEKFKEIQKAYEAIKDAESRREYELQRRAEEMEERASKHAASSATEKYTFRTGPSTFRGSFAFNADDLQDVFSRAFRGRNKENTRPKDGGEGTSKTYRNTFDFGKPEWDNQWASGGDPLFTFNFGFEEPRSSARGEQEDIFDRFFHDPFFMDSFPFAGADHGTPRSARDNTSPFRPPTAKSAAERAAEERAKIAAEEKAKEEALRKEAQRKAKDAAEKRAKEQKERLEKTKRETQRMYDWQNGLFGKKSDETSSENKDLPTAMKLTCNYCNTKFHPAQLTIHEKDCRDAYYGTNSNASDSSNEEPFSGSFKPKPEDFKTNEAYIPKAEAASSTTYPSGGEASSSSYVPKSEQSGGGSYTPRAPSAERKPASSSVKNDILRNAYRGAINETIQAQAAKNVVPEEPKAQEFVPCQHCGGSFSTTVAKYHIPFCGRKHGHKASDTNNNTSSASSPGPSRARDLSADDSSRPSYRSTARPSPMATGGATSRSAYDRVTSPSFTNLGATRSRPTVSATTRDYMGYDYDYDYDYDYPDYINPLYTGSLSSPSYTGLGYSKYGSGSLGRSEVHTLNAGYEPYSSSYHVPRAQTNSHLGRPSASSTRIRYVPSHTRTRLGPHVGI